MSVWAGEIAKQLTRPKKKKKRRANLPVSGTTDIAHLTPSPQSVEPEFGKQKQQPQRGQQEILKQTVLNLKKKTNPYNDIAQKNHQEASDSNQQNKIEQNKTKQNKTEKH